MEREKEAEKGESKLFMGWLKRAWVTSKPGET